MQLTSTQIKYILTLYEISTDKTKKKNLTEIAAKLNVSKPSAHRMMVQLTESGIIEIPKRGCPCFTETGIQLARQYTEMYRTILGFLVCELKMEHSCAEINTIALLGSGKTSAVEMCNCIANR